jgi:hypothetical protein
MSFMFERCALCNHYFKELFSSLIHVHCFFHGYFTDLKDGMRIQNFFQSLRLNIYFNSHRLKGILRMQQHFMI